MVLLFNFLVTTGEENLNTVIAQYLLTKLTNLTVIVTIMLMFSVIKIELQDNFAKKRIINIFLASSIQVLSCSIQIFFFYKVPRSVSVCDTKSYNTLCGAVLTNKESAIVRFHITVYICITCYLWFY